MNVFAVPAGPTQTVIELFLTVLKNSSCFGVNLIDLKSDLSRIGGMMAAFSFSSVNFLCFPIYVKCMYFYVSFQLKRLD